MNGTHRWQFWVGGIILIAAVAYLIIANTTATAKYFYTVDELLAQPESERAKPIRISGAVVGESIAYDAATLSLTFEIAHVPADQDEVNALGGLATVLHQASNDPNAARLKVHYIGEKPDLLRSESQAILDGTLGADGVFQADTLQLKCPTRYDSQLGTPIPTYVP